MSFRTAPREFEGDRESGPVVRGESRSGRDRRRRCGALQSAWHAVDGVRGPREENRLRQEILSKNGPDEILALLKCGAFRGQSSIVVRVQEGRTRLSGCGRDRDLSAGALHDFEEWLTAHRVEELGPLPLRVCDGIRYEFLRITRAGGYRVRMNNPGMGHPFDLPWQNLVRRFLQLVGEGK